MAAPVRFLVENYSHLMRNESTQRSPRLFMGENVGESGRTVELRNAEGTIIAIAKSEDWEETEGETFKLYHHSFVTVDREWIFAFVRDGETSPFVWYEYRQGEEGWGFETAAGGEGDTGIRTIIYYDGANWMNYYKIGLGIRFYGIQKNSNVEVAYKFATLYTKPVSMERKRYGGRDTHGAIIWTEMDDDRIYYKGQVVGTGAVAQVDPYGMYVNDPQYGYISSITFTPAIQPKLQRSTRDTVRALLFLARAQSAGRVDRGTLVASNYQQLPADLLYVLWSWVLSAGPN